MRTIPALFALAISISLFTACAHDGQEAQPSLSQPVVLKWGGAEYRGTTSARLAGEETRMPYVEVLAQGQNGKDKLQMSLRLPYPVEAGTYALASLPQAQVSRSGGNCHGGTHYIPMRPQDGGVTITSMENTGKTFTISVKAGVLDEAAQRRELEVAAVKAAF